MINYSVRRYQNQIISRVMQNEGPTGLPARLAQLYSAHLPSFTIRPSPALAWFDYQALRRIRRAAEFSPPAPPLHPQYKQQFWRRQDRPPGPNPPGGRHTTGKDHF